MWFLISERVSGKCRSVSGIVYQCGAREPPPSSVIAPTVRSRDGTGLPGSAIAVPTE